MNGQEEDEWTFDQAVENTQDARERLNRASETTQSARRTLDETAEVTDHLSDVIDDLDDDLNQAVDQLHSTEGDVDKTFEYLEYVEETLAHEASDNEVPPATLTLTLNGSSLTMELPPGYNDSEAAFADTLIRSVGTIYDDLAANGDVETAPWSSTGVFRNAVRGTSYFNEAYEKTDL